MDFEELEEKRLWLKERMKKQVEIYAYLEAQGMPVSNVILLNGWGITLVIFVYRLARYVNGIARVDYDNEGSLRFLSQSL